MSNGLTPEQETALYATPDPPCEVCLQELDIDARRFTYLVSELGLSAAGREWARRKEERPRCPRCLQFLPPR